MRIVFTGGGTGGHLYPIVAVAREIQRIVEDERRPAVELFYFGPEAVPPEVMDAEGITFHRIAAGKIRRYFSLLNFTDTFKTLFGILQALGRLFGIMPDVVFAKGGYGSFPTLLVARLYRIPVIIHESDAIPGRVNRWAGKWADRIAIAFPAAADYFPETRTALTGIPVRRRLLGGNPEEAREAFGAYSKRPVIFVTGGSQGAAVINESVAEILKELVAHYEIIHQVGGKNVEEMRLETTPILEGGGEAYYHPVGFLDETKMRSAYLLADLVISRAGATAIFEISAWAKPAILIPIKNSAQDHQRANAYTYGGHGAAIVIEEDNLTSSVLLNEIQKLMASPEHREKMSEAARAFARPDAAEFIAREILRLGSH